MKVITIQISDELHTELFNAASKHEISASLYVRLAIKEKLAAEVPGEVVEFPERPTPNASSAAVTAPRNKAEESFIEKKDRMFDKLREDAGKPKAKAWI